MSILEEILPNEIITGMNYTYKLYIFNCFDNNKFTLN